MQYSMNSGTELDQIFHTHVKHRAGVVDRGVQSSLLNIYFISVVPVLCSHCTKV